MKRYFKSIIGVIIGLFIICFGIMLIKNNILNTKVATKEDKINNLININKLDDEFVDDYFKEISEVDSDEDKKNMLIVISNDNIKNSYGAERIIEAPNNQYFLQYSSKEDKELALNKFKEDKGIESVEENGIYKTEEVEYNSWGIEKMSLDYAITLSNSDYLNMNPVTVAIIDTGCDMSLFNKYYAGKISEVYNVLENSTVLMVDEDGHGTHIAGTIAEGTPDYVKIIPLKVSRNGSMFYSDVIAAINYIVYNEKADVINMSFGGYGYNEALDQAIESAKAKNIISVAAAGNDNAANKHYPAALDNTISIASVDSDLKKSSFSNYGAEVTFAAPGTNIKSIMGEDTNISKGNGNKDGDDDHETISGTSMATPHAVSAVALLKGYNKNLTFDNVVDILKDNAIDLGEEGWDQYYGNGLISFKDVVFCDGTYCDELGVYKNLDKSISNIDAVNLRFTHYNYYSITNLMGSKVNVTYTDGSNEELLIGELPNVEILNYDPTLTGDQTITIKVENLTKIIQITNPNNYESGWEYNTLASGKIEITGYKNHNLGIKRLYVPEAIDSKQVVSFADNFKFVESGTDIEFYTYLYLPSTFTRIGNYSLAGTNIKYIYGSNDIEVGNHSFEDSSIVSINVPVTKVGEYAFKDCFELLSIDMSGKYLYESANHTQIAETYIEKYAFYNCKKLSRIIKSKYDTVFVEKIGEYAFYNCVSLSYFGLEPESDIEEYAFYNTFLLSDINLYNSVSIGNYAFYGSGISEVNFGLDFESVNESAFENCKNLKELSFDGKRIEKRAFWGSGIETIVLSNAEYIAEDAFAYSPIKGSNGIFPLNGDYQVISHLGIVKNGNKLIVGFTDGVSPGASNTNITEDITEIGEYAFTGNNKLRRIIIPANVSKIGTHSFEDCYNLSDVYMLGNNINFGDDTFKRAFDGEIKGADLYIYVYKASSIKQFVKDKNLNYRHIDPDEVVVTNYEDTYKALSQVDWKNLNVKLIYHEEEDREEVLSTWTSTQAPISRGVGYFVRYQTPNNYCFNYGDTYFVVEAKNALGYSSTKNIKVTILKETPSYTVPDNLTGVVGQKLSDIKLPNGFEWMDDSALITKSGDIIFKAKYIPDDTVNYEIVENIDINVLIESNDNYYDILIDSDNIVSDTFNINLNINPLSDNANNIKSLIGNIDYDKTKLELVSYNTIDKFNVSLDNNTFNINGAPGINTKSNILTLKFKNIGLNELDKTTITIKELIANNEELSLTKNEISKEVIYSKNGFIKGDMNSNGRIDLKDIIILIKKYLGTLDSSNEDIVIGDMNTNGKLDLKDIIILIKTYLGN